MRAHTEIPDNQGSRFTRFAQARPLILFFLLAYLWSWTIWLAVPAIAQRIGINTDLGLFEIAVIVIGACGPTMAAFITRWLGCRDLRICRVWTGTRPLLAGLALGFALLFLATLVAPALALVQASPHSLHWSALLRWSSYTVNYSTLIGGPLNEEPGWRGFALPRLQERFGYVLATMILALLWAGWHLPLFQIPGWSSASPAQFFLTLVGISFLLTAIANFSKFNVLAAVLFHAFFNTSAGLVNVLTQGLPPRPHAMWNYALAVFLTGSTLGWIALRSIRANKANPGC
jgi:membrane protease YdiL (CAAX protease family)